MQTTRGAFTLLLLLTGLSVQAQETGTEPAGEAGVEDFEPAVSSQELLAAPAENDAGVAPADAPVMVAAEDVRRRAVNSGVMDEIDLGRTEITGNQELPKVLYIVPWQKSDPGDLTGRPINTLLDEVMAPIDRSEFMRQVEYYDDLYRTTEE